MQGAFLYSVFIETKHGDKQNGSHDEESRIP